MSYQNARVSTKPLYDVSFKAITFYSAAQLSGYTVNWFYAGCNKILSSLMFNNNDGWHPDNNFQFMNYNQKDFPIGE